jgi:hypothetical protein
MNTHFGRLGVVVSLALLAACASNQQTLQSGSAVVPQAPLMVPDHGHCGGTKGVNLTPCPVKLTSSSSVIVTVKGRGIKNSGVIKSCGDICGYSAYGGSSDHYTRWQISPGIDCGIAELKFVAWNGADHLVGYGYLKVVNKYCP